MTIYMIGEKVWFKGDEVTVTTEPYMKYNAEWQNAITEDGKTICIVTPRQAHAEVKQQRQVWLDQQAGFSRLHKLQNKSK